MNVNPNVNHSNDSNHLPNYGSDTPKPGEHVAGSPGYDPKKTVTKTVYQEKNN
ncbi:hypothetical protein ACN9VA_05110 [Staphylococcus caprae]|uniref:hypothetical protein n=1 Tax=Staphylococcus caprae TaxID=29380 RepID=UPI0015F9E966|nr:hypothetical protein [Staphylococcus caprae]